jgi:hypothetical protein
MAGLVVRRLEVKECLNLVEFDSDPLNLGNNH